MAGTRAWQSRPEYADTYHNIGFRVLAELARKFGVRIREKCGPALISSRFEIAGKSAVLVAPQTFMNLSGAVLPRLFERFETSSGRLIVVYDDIALPLGKLRITAKRFGWRSQWGKIHSFRLRLGRVPASARWDSAGAAGFTNAGFRLSRVAKADLELLGQAEAAAADAVEALIADGAEKAMATFNRLDLREAKEN